MTSQQKHRVDAWPSRLKGSSQMCFRLQERQERAVLCNYDDHAQTETLHVMLLFTNTLLNAVFTAFILPQEGKTILWSAMIVKPLCRVSLKLIHCTIACDSTTHTHCTKRILQKR